MAHSRSQQYPPCYIPINAYGMSGTSPQIDCQFLEDRGHVSFPHLAKCSGRIRQPFWRKENDQSTPKGCITQPCPTTWVLYTLASRYVALASSLTALLLDKLRNHKQACLSQYFPTLHLCSRVQLSFLSPRSISIGISSISPQSFHSSTERFSFFWNPILSVNQMVFG